MTVWSSSLPLCSCRGSCGPHSLTALFHAQVECRNESILLNIVIRNIFEMHKYWDSHMQFWDFVGALVTPCAMFVLCISVVDTGGCNGFS